jgi:DnaJ-class molecular chaperone
MSQLPVESVNCATCEGTAFFQGASCVVCDGNGHVTVVSPPVLCPHCKGNGKATENDRHMSELPTCLVCLGAGWARLIHPLSAGLGSS